MDQQVLTSRDIIGMIDNGIESSKDTSWPFLTGMEFKSNQAVEKYKLIGASPALREWVGGRSVKSLRTAGIDVTNKKFEATIRVDKDDLRRDKTGFINVRIGELVGRYTQHWAKLVTTLRVAGTATAAYDGQFFYSASHAFGDSGTMKNLLVAGDYAQLNVTTPANPTAAELSDAILAVIQHFYSFKDDQGEPVNEDAKKFMVQVPVNMYGALIKALTSNFLLSGSAALDNPLKSGDFEIIPSVNPRLSATDAFYVDRIDGVAKAFILQSESDYELSAKAEGSDFEHDNDAHEYGIKCLRNAGFGFFTSSIKATLS